MHFCNTIKQARKTQNKAAYLLQDKYILRNTVVELKHSENSTVVIKCPVVTAFKYYGLNVTLTWGTPC